MFATTHRDLAMHFLVVAVIAMLVALAVASLIVLHRRARTALTGRESLATDSEAMLIESSSETVH